MDATFVPRRAAAADLPRVREVVTAAYTKYLTRMDRPPAPMLRDYTGPARAGLVWVIGRVIYNLGYASAPESRHIGFGISGIATSNGIARP